MLYLEHLNLTVKSIPATLRFYQAAFPHWRIRGGELADWHGHERYWVHFGDDYQYLTFNDQGTGNNRDLTSNQLGLAHFAFVVSDLTGLIERLAGAGFQRTSGGDTLPNRKNAYYIDPNGFEVEFVEYYTDIPRERNSYTKAQGTIVSQLSQEGYQCEW